MTGWTTWIKNRITKNKNFIGFVGGPTGSGKSWTCLSIAEQIDPNFNIDQVVFKALDLMRLVNSNKLRPGSVIIFEEAGVELSNRNWQNIVNKMLNYLLQTFRHKQLILLMNSPYMDFIDKSSRKLIHAHFKVMTIDRDNKQTIIKPQLIQYNERKDKFYYKYLRVVKARIGIQCIKEWAVNKPSEKIIADYEAKKSLYTSNLNNDIITSLIAKENKEKKENKPQWHCKDCGHEWVPRSEKPAYCPKCQKREYIYVKDAVST